MTDTMRIFKWGVEGGKPTAGQVGAAAMAPYCASKHGLIGLMRTVAKEAAARLGVNGSWDFAFELMQRVHLAVTPGREFGQAAPERFVRFSTANSMAELQTAIARLKAWLHP